MNPIVLFKTVKNNSPTDIFGYMDMIMGMFMGMIIGIYLNKKYCSENYNKKHNSSSKKNSTKYNSSSENKIIKICNNENKNENLAEKIIEILHNENNLKSKYISKHLEEIYKIIISKRDLNRGILKELKKKNKIFYNENYEYYVKKNM